MTDRQTFVIVGAGLAGASAAAALRSEGFAGRIVLVGAEPHPPYERPPLSKGYLAGAADRASVFVHPEPWYAENRVELRRSTRVTELDRRRHQVVLDSGDRLGYDRLLLTTGARPRTLAVLGADQVDVRYLRSVDDSDRLRTDFSPGARVVLVGAGWIGLETAAAARGAGCDVVVLEHAELPLLRVLGPEVAGVFAGLHRDHGVDLRCGVTLTGVRPAGPGRTSSATVHLDDGTELEADVVLAGVGVLPDTDLAGRAGLDVDDGILVDSELRTSDPDVFAAGDVANAAHPLLGRSIRVEHWANALNQPRTAARAMLGLPTSYDRLPYFFSDQYDLGLEYTGYVSPGGYDQVVVRGDPASRQFIAFWMSGARVLAGMNVNVWDVTGPIGDLIRSGSPVDTARLADPGVALADAVTTSPAP
ncbi:3-phenylpropionate/trans-cinnamate dioxygenase ferredoxin reductase subunit [Modestobacter sp. DSM 44400]|uniref:NAD(P)/FAD-dependent oxidoreductase n=1 Tax=Modestobacter sp. DSM 44400 TaxID=1550230 RepID=UPI00089439B0|nr:FAD-dependent oxidoreductase [Modestobacter sp. DSM 44400]SDX90625.1 3-phenylpropionate/trans-cinnamate dioxygenase ferredoxin reductase subunit [Modestobacter sp. DSM 44400]